MAMELTRSGAILDLVREGLEEYAAADLLVALAEYHVWLAQDRDDSTLAFDCDLYDQKLADLRELHDRGVLAVDTMRAQLLDAAIDDIQTAGEGHYTVYVCPYGCHTVTLAD